MLGTTINEEQVVQIWERQAFDRSTCRARGIDVVFRGVPSDAGGPDYQDALIAFGEGTVVSGDVEFHVDAADWYHHRHHLDPHYNRVILHVVWSAHNHVTLRHDGVSIPVLELRACCTGPPAALTQAQLMEHPCVRTFRALSEVEIEDSLVEAARERFADRAALFAMEAEDAGQDQAAYSALLEAMGYASNRQMFRELAECAPLSWLLSVWPSERAEALHVAAGFLPANHLTPPARVSVDSWRLARLRPGNHPARRLGAIASVVTALGPRLATSLILLVENADRPSDLRRPFLISNQHGAIGRGRADELIVSVVLPFVAGLTPGSTVAWDWFLRYPAPPANRWTRTVSALWNDAGKGPSVRRAVQHQGMHAMYHGHCRSGRSVGCPACMRVAAR